MNTKSFLSFLQDLLGIVDPQPLLDEIKSQTTELKEKEAELHRAQEKINSMSSQMAVLRSFQL